MSNPYGETNPDEQRPQPRYGAYSQSSEGSGEAPGEQPPSYGTSPHGGQHNPYGQPSWGQPDGGDPGRQSDQPNPYGQPSHPGQQSGAAPAGWQQSGQPAPGPYPGPPVVEKPKRPTTMILSMVLMLIAAGLSLVWGIYVLVTMQAQDAESLMSEQMREAMVQSFQADPQLQDLSPEEAMDMALLGIGAFALFWAFILVAIYVTLAFVGTMTGNVGRVLATIWLAGSLFFLLLGYDGATYSIIAATVLVSVGALVLLWLPPSNTFVQQRRAYKDARRRAPYAGPPGGPPPGYSGPASGHNSGQQGYGPGQPSGSQPAPGPGGQNPYGGHNPYGN